MRLRCCCACLFADNRLLFSFANGAPHEHSFTPYPAHTGPRQA